MIQLRELHDQPTWHAHIQTLPAPHLLQSWNWGAFKSRYGWEPYRLAWFNENGSAIAAAQVLVRKIRLSPTPIELTVLYCPKGPLLDWSMNSVDIHMVMRQLIDFARQHKAIFIKIDPDLPLAFGSEPDELHPNAQTDGMRLLADIQAAGWQSAAEQIQFRNTMLLDLSGNEEELLATMKSKTRYNIRLAAKRGVTVRMGSLEDLDQLYQMYAETSLRDGFAIRNHDYYRAIWETFIQADMAQPFVAEVDQQPVAGALAFKFLHRAWYLHGMSTGQHRKKMPNHLLQWEIIRWAQQQGCDSYDLWGAPDVFSADDHMWGVYRFKKGFAANILQTPGALDYPMRKGWYWIYTRALPALMHIWRKLGRRQTARTSSIR